MFWFYGLIFCVVVHAIIPLTSVNTALLSRHIVLGSGLLNNLQGLTHNFFNIYIFRIFLFIVAFLYLVLRGGRLEAIDFTAVYVAAALCLSMPKRVVM